MTGITRFDMQKEATQHRIADALERVAAALERLVEQNEDDTTERVYLQRKKESKK